MLAPFFKKKDSDTHMRTAGKNKPEEAAEAAETAASVEANTAVTEPANHTAESAARNEGLGRSHLDKMSLDLIGAAEQMIQAKQRAEQHVAELQDRLTHAGAQSDRLSRDIRSLNKVIEEREKSISELEQKLHVKNLKVDQVMEDYRELQTAKSAESDELKGQIELEQQKYAALLSKHNESQAEKSRKIGELEERIAKLETENAHLKTKYEAQRQEKAYLVQMVNDFTNRMSAPFDAGRMIRPEGEDG